MRGQTDLKSMKKGVHWIENQGENLYKMLKICLINFCVPFDQRCVLVSLELFFFFNSNCDRDTQFFFLQKEGVNWIMMGYKIETQLD